MIIDRLIQKVDNELASMDSEAGLENSGVHEHAWENGVCYECGAKCSHSFHDINGICDLCGKQVFHKYIDGFCECGKELEFITGLLPEEYYEPCDERGTTETYLIKGNLDLKTPAEKRIDVYLPYGYNPEQKYDVMFLEGGLGNPFNALTSSRWRIYYSESNPKKFSFRDIYDHMIQNGDCEPMIIVGIDGYSKTKESDRLLDGFEEGAYFLRHDVYPFIIENYSTYAESILEEDIIAARDHFGIGGFSNGGYMTFWGGMKTLLPYMANFMPISGSIRGEAVGNHLAEHPEYPVRAFFCAAGAEDAAAYNQTRWDFFEAIWNSGYLEENVNSWFVTQDFGHDWETGVTAVYNGLQVMFPPQPQAAECGLEESA